ncbi:MAG: hypothetical protein M3Q97_05435 [Bacteroidota bacterium]|nr:hypothetical protein [Bacteroidota bacterium]
MRSPALFTVLLVVLLSGGCRKDFEVNAPWKEIHIIYGLMDRYDSMGLARDTIQYVRITKAFLNEDESALTIAQVSDSIYLDTLDVTLEEWRNGFKTEYKMLEVYNDNKDSGIFASPGQYLYRTPPGFILKLDASYTIIVLNPKTGVKSTASTPVVNPPYPLFPSTTTKSYTFSKGENAIVNWRPALNAKFYDLKIRMNYSEWNASDSSKIGDYRLNWTLFTFRTDITGQDMRQVFPGDDFYKFIAGQLQPKTGVYRKMGLIDFIIQSGGEEIYTYIQVNRPSIGIVQKKPEYTNVNNGFGIFSSRNTFIITVPLSEKSITTLINQSPTRELGFVR